MTKEELKIKIKNLEGYNQTLVLFQKKIEQVIHKTEMEIRRVCNHEILKYCVASRNGFNYDDDRDYHCQYCEDCETLFVIRKFKFLEKEIEEPYRRLDLDSNLYFNAKVYVDWKSKRDAF